LECLLWVLSLRLHKCLKTIDMKPRDGKDATQDIFYVILITALFLLVLYWRGRG
jgi:hypothetical protein